MYSWPENSDENLVLPPTHKIIVGVGGGGGVNEFKVLEPQYY